MADLTNQFKVRLISVSSITNGDYADQVIFDVTPSFSESRSVSYSAVTPVHMPGSIQVYKNTASRTFNIGAHFISRTVDEASQNMVNLQTLRGWTMPYFGSTSTIDSSQHAARLDSVSLQNRQDTMSGPPAERKLTLAEHAKNAQARASAGGIELRGAPPDVLYLYAYSTDKNNGSSDYEGDRPVTCGVNINKIPVVITELSITYPEDVDYLPTYSDTTAKTIDENSEPFPIKMDVTITLAETHSPREYETFDLIKYKQGTLANF